MESSINIPSIMQQPSTAGSMDGSPEQAEAQLQQDLEQRQAWAQDQLKIHTSAVRAAESIIRACQAGIEATQMKSPDSPGF